MPVSTILVEEGHIIHQVFTDPWSVDEVIAMRPKIMGYLAQTPHKIHYLADISRTRRLQPGLMRTSQSPFLHHPQFGRIVIVGATPLFQSIGETIFRITGFEQGKFFQTETDAWAFLREIIKSESAQA
jgi:hypothetical protein